MLFSNQIYVNSLSLFPSGIIFLQIYKLGILIRRFLIVAARLSFTPRNFISHVDALFLFAYFPGGKSPLMTFFYCEKYLSMHLYTLRVDLWKIKACLSAIIYLSVTAKKNKAATEKRKIAFFFVSEQKLWPVCLTLINWTWNIFHRRLGSFRSEVGRKKIPNAKKTKLEVDSIQQFFGGLPIFLFGKYKLFLNK